MSTELITADRLFSRYIN